MKERIKKIYFRKDGRYEIRYHYGYKYDGTPNYKSVYGKSEKEVIGNYHQVLDDLINKNDLFIYDKTYIGYDINLWLNNAKIKSLLILIINILLNLELFQSLLKLKKNQFH